MEFKSCLAILFFFLCIQDIACDDELRSCTQKAFDQLNKITNNGMPACFKSGDKLKTLNEKIEKYQNISKQVKKDLPPDCSKSTKNAAACVEAFASKLAGKGNSIAGDFVDSWKAIFEASTGCIDTLKDGFMNLDKYVLNGCQ